MSTEIFTLSKRKALIFLLVFSLTLWKVQSRPPNPEPYYGGYGQQLLNPVPYYSAELEPLPPYQEISTDAETIRSNGDGVDAVVQCAKIWNNFGMGIHLGLNQGVSDFEVYNFIPVQIEIRERCVLFMVDTAGEISVTYDSVLGGEKCWLLPLCFAHCESCLGKMPNTSGVDPNFTCAIMYDAPLCSTQMGFAKEVKVGEEEAWMDSLYSRKTSSIVVRDGCSLEIYEAEGYDGSGAVVTGTVDLLTPDWNDRIASFKCKCDEMPVIPEPISTSTTTTTSKPTPISSTTPEITTLKASTSSTTTTIPTTPSSTSTTAIPTTPSSTPVLSTSSSTTEYFSPTPTPTPLSSSTSAEPISTTLDRDPLY